MTLSRERRQPPPFRRVEVAGVEQRSPHMTRITLAGSELSGFDPAFPAASLRLLLRTGPAELELPTWQGNQFLLEDGSRPIIRTLTPLRFEADALELDVDVVRHGNGPLSAWAGSARVGERVAVSGTGRRYEIDASTQSFLLAGDESALPAIATVLQALGTDVQVQTFIEVRDTEARLDLPSHPNATVRWLQLPEASPAGECLFDAIKGAELHPDVRIWAAGEAAAMQRIRRHLFDERGLARSSAVVRGYWKHGRDRDRAGQTGG